MRVIELLSSLSATTINKTNVANKDNLISLSQKCVMLLHETVSNNVIDYVNNEYNYNTI